MARILSHLNTAKHLLEHYKGILPFAAHLKNFFALHKKYGSKDRKSISALCFCYFRLGKAYAGAALEEKIAAGVFLCENQPHLLLDQLHPEWNEVITQPLEEKLKHVPGFDVNEVFAFTKDLGSEVEPLEFAKSFLLQPLLFIRVRPGCQAQVSMKLKDAGVLFTLYGEDCLAFENGTKLEDILELNKEYVVQDYSSQRVGELMKRVDVVSPFNVWDCCAASGGKSILALDTLPQTRLFVSDIRQSILHNLNKRLATAGVTSYDSQVIDLTNKRAIGGVLGQQQFDLVICDAPCSGSGTWSRTPEQLLFFKQAEIERYSNLQQTILQNVSTYVKPGGYILYITCSVFSSENQVPVNMLLQSFPFKLIHSELFSGYNKRADTLFAALLQRDVPVN